MSQDRVPDILVPVTGDQRFDAEVRLPHLASAEHGYAALSAGAVRLGLAVPGPGDVALIGRHTGVGLAVADLEAEHERLAGLGVRFTMPPTRQPWGGFMALVADPDDNVSYLDQT